jgi:thymidylate synthase
MRVNEIRQMFIDKLANEEFVTDKTGAKTIEIIGASFLADEPAIFGEPNKKYIKAELDWYDSQSTNINKLAEIYGKSPAAWEYCANEYGEINSNYGEIVFAGKHYHQFYRAAVELIKNPDSRRAQIVYNRPSIWVEYDEDGKNDFICTNAQTFYIRNNELHMVSQMRSNDAVFGYKNDQAWARHLQTKMCSYLNKGKAKGASIIYAGELTWQVMNMHIYSRHFDLVVNHNG